MSLSIVVPTLGKSPLLAACLAALRADGGDELEIVLVDQGERAVEVPRGLDVRRLRLGRNEGFAGGVNRGIESTSSEWIGTVNDDLVVEPGWCEALCRALDGDAEVAAVQGLVLRHAEPTIVDGAGLRFNRWWQAVQIGHGEPAAEHEGEPREVFGASATAVVYRRAALDAVRLAGGSVFDPRLGSYYEDVDLACRLRAAGWKALVVPAARARHAGSASLGSARLRLVYGNRLAVLARLMGRALWRQLPRIAARDALDLLRALAALRFASALGIVRGLARGARLLPGYAHRGAPAPALEEIRRRESR